MKNYTITLELDEENLPYETALIEGLIANGNLGSFLYTVANDVIEERYNLDAGHTQIVLKQIISTVASIFDTVSSMDTNISDITGSLNQHTEVLEAIERLTPILAGVQSTTTTTTIQETAVVQETKIDEWEPEVMEYNAIELEYDTGVDDGLGISAEMEDLFDFDMNS